MCNQIHFWTQPSLGNHPFQSRQIDPLRFRTEKIEYFAFRKYFGRKFTSYVQEFISIEKTQIRCKMNSRLFHISRNLKKWFGDSIRSDISFTRWKRSSRWVIYAFSLYQRVSTTSPWCYRHDPKISKFKSLGNQSATTLNTRAWIYLIPLNFSCGAYI